MTLEIGESTSSSGRGTMTLRIRGLEPMIWAMLSSLCSSMSRVCSCLGSQEPEGGVVLGLALLMADFW